MPSDHQNAPHHWYSKYTTKLSAVAESYSEKHRWGNEVVDRVTGEKIWEPMPLVSQFLLPRLMGHSTPESECICCSVGSSKMKVLLLAVSRLLKM